MTPETPEQRIERWRAQLAVAACLNSTHLYSPVVFDRTENVRDMLLHELTDYFGMNEESEQFDRDSTLRYVRELPIADLVFLLDQMGKNPFSQMMVAFTEGEQGQAVPLWKSFVERINAKIDKQEAAVNAA